jgi:hypothetical protein
LFLFNLRVLIVQYASKFIFWLSRDVTNS